MTAGAEEAHQRVYTYDEREIWREYTDGEDEADEQRGDEEKKMVRRCIGPNRHGEYEPCSDGNP